MQNYTAHIASFLSHLKSRTLICQLPDLICSQHDLLLPNGVVTPGVVVSRVLLTSDHLQEIAVQSNSYV